MIRLFSVVFLVCSGLVSFAQDQDSLMIRRIFDMALTQGKAYTQLDELCKKAPARLSGSQNAKNAVELTYEMLKEVADSVWLQEVMVPHWVRGSVEKCNLVAGGKTTALSITALGNSVGTGDKMISAQVVEVRSIEALDSLGADKIKGKIVFFNRPMDPRFIDTFDAYGGCADQRVWGADEAAKYGAVAVIVRSLGLRLDNHPHTGVVIYKGDVKIPGAAISTLHADLLSTSLKQFPTATVQLQLSCKLLPDALSYNVIGQIRGTKFPNEIVLVGGHLDSWDNSEGAHDDGAGVVHAMEVLYLFKKLGIKPERTIRCVLFMNEENGSRGAKVYAEEARKKGENHIAAIESDRGGFAPRGFTVEGSDVIFDAAYLALRKASKHLRAYNLHIFEPGGSGVDVSKLKDQHTALYGFVPDSQRYFDVHHASEDKFIHVNKRELELGCASIAAFTYLLQKYGVPSSVKKSGNSIMQHLGK